jgi:hypothetical protein
MREHDVRCCENPFQEITVQAGAGALALVRCSSCDRQQWSRDGQVVDRDEAFAMLASAYREVPLRARAARDRAASLSAARQAARLAERGASQPRTVTLPDARPDAAHLMTMLEGWQVLGATA